MADAVSRQIELRFTGVGRSRPDLDKAPVFSCFLSPFVRIHDRL